MGHSLKLTSFTLEIAGKGGKALHDTLFWQAETTGLKPGVTSQPTNCCSVVTVLDLIFWKHSYFQDKCAHQHFIVL